MQSKELSRRSTGNAKNASDPGCEKGRSFGVGRTRTSAARQRRSAHQGAGLRRLPQRFGDEGRFPSVLSRSCPAMRSPATLMPSAPALLAGRRRARRRGLVRRPLRPVRACRRGNSSPAGTCPSPACTMMVATPNRWSRPPTAGANPGRIYRRGAGAADVRRRDHL